MAKRPEPAGDFILAIDAPRDVAIDGIIMPDNQRQQDMLFGTVMFVGPKATATNARDLICYGPYAGKMVAFEGVEFRLLREGQIELYVRDDHE